MERNSGTLQFDLVTIQATIDALSAHLCILDRDGTIVLVNRAWREFAAANPPTPTDSFLGKNYLQVCDTASGPNAEEAAPFAAGLRAVMGGEKKEFILEYPCHSPGKQGWYIARVTRFSVHRSYHTVVVHEDITQRKLVEIRLHEHEERLRLALQGANDGLWDWNLTTDEVLFSPRWKSMLGYEEHELIGNLETWKQLVHPDDLESTLVQVNELVLGQKERFETEFRMRHKDGHYVDILSRAFLVQRENNTVIRLVGTHVDISARKQVERDLAASEIRFRSYIENAPTAIFVADRQGRFVDCNQASLELLGYDAKTFFEMRLLEVTPTEDHALLFQGLAALNHTGFFEGELRQITRKGQTIWISLRAVKLTDDRYLAYCQDITKRKLIEEALRKSETLLSNAVKIAHLGYWEYDVAADLFTFNDQFYAVYRTTAEQEGGYQMSAEQYAERFIPPEEQSVVAAEIQKSLRSTEPNYSSQTEHKIRYADGTIGYISVRISGIRDAEGRLVKSIGVNQDITEQKRAEEETKRRAIRSEMLAHIAKVLSISTANYQDLLDYLSRLGSELVHGAFAIRLISEDGQWLEPAAISLSGQDRKNAVSRMAGQGRIPVNHGANGQVLQTGQTAVYPSILPDQIPFLMHPTTQTWLEGYAISSMVIMPLIAQGQTIGTLTAYSLAGEPIITNEDVRFLESIAEQAALSIANARLMVQVQQQNAELEQRVNERTADLNRTNAELIRASRVKDEFLAMMSHELRTPLNAILTLAESLEEGTYGFLSDRQTKQIRKMAESGDHLLVLINDILDLSKLEAGRVEVELAPLDVEPFCQACLRLVQQQADKKRQRVSLRIDASVHSIIASERYLKQALVNLLSNAVKFTPETGQIGMEVEGDGEQEIVHFSIWDTGIGIAQKDMERLFKPFVQIDSSLSREYEGTGLGLALVAHFAEQHGGSVSVESTPGAGSRFTISLPWNQANRKVDSFVEDTESFPDEEDIRKRDREEMPLLLIAEDSPTIREAYSDYLFAKGYRVAVATNGVEALAIVQQMRPDLILMDIQMPVMDGLEAIRRLRAEPVHSKVPIIALTALVMPGDKERCLAAGADEYLAKPVHLRTIIRVIEDYLAK